jgi:hypothetical protein
MAQWLQPLSGTLGPQKGCGFKTHWCADESPTGSLPLSLTWGYQVSTACQVREWFCASKIKSIKKKIQTFKP